MGYTLLYRKENPDGLQKNKGEQTSNLEDA